LTLLRDWAEEESIPFPKAISKCKVSYNPGYAKFLIRLSTLLDTYPRLLQSGQPVRWFKINMPYIEEICAENKLEWSEQPQQHYADDAYIE
jgi:hypothetical protein